MEELYTLYRPELLAYCRRLCRNVCDPEDLVQETFLKALSDPCLMERLGRKEKRAWLYKVARNLFYDLCRRRATERKHVIGIGEETDGGFTEAETAMVLSSLPPELSVIFIKHYFEGFSSRELAERFGLSPSGIRAGLNRARKLLRDRMDQQGG